MTPVLVKPVFNGHLNVLEWLEKRTTQSIRYQIKNIPTTSDYANSAAYHGYLHILKWLAERGRVPDLYGL